MFTYGAAQTKDEVAMRTHKIQASTGSVDKSVRLTTGRQFALYVARTRRFASRVVLLGVLLLVVLTGSVQAQESCELDGVKIGFQAKTCAFDDYTISLNGAGATGFGTGCISFLEFPNLTNKAWTRLKLNKTYIVTAGFNLCITHINFEVPEGYTMYINGVESKTIFQTDQGRIRSGDGSWEVVVRKKCPCTNGDAGTTAPQNGSVVWDANLGRLRDGRSAEQISIRETMLSSTIYTPSVLVYSPPPKTNESTSLRTRTVVCVRLKRRRH